MHYLHYRVFQTSVTIFLFVSLYFLTSGCDMEHALMNNDQLQSENLIVKLENGADLRSVIDFSTEYQFQIQGVSYEWYHQYGGYASQQNLAQEDVENIINGFINFLRLLIKNLEETQIIDQQSTIDNQSFNELSSLLQLVEDGILPVHAIQIRSTNPETLAQLQNDSRVQSIEVVQKSPQKSKNLDLAPFLSSYHESWAPYKGYSKVNSSLAFNRVYFNNKSAYKDTSTYEQESQVYDVNFANYGNYWASDFPCAYLDTGVGDSIDNFTIGSACAKNFTLYYGYYTSIGLYPGSVKSATVRIKGQIGHRYPSWCYSTWCIFADATTSSMYTFTAPNSGAWWTY